MQIVDGKTVEPLKDDEILVAVYKIYGYWAVWPHISRDVEELEASVKKSQSPNPLESLVIVRVGL